MGKISLPKRFCFCVSFQFLLPFMLHSEIQRQMLVTSQRQSVFVLLHAPFFHFQGAGKVGNQKLTLWAPQMLALLRLTIVQMPILTSDFCRAKVSFSTYTFLFSQYRNGSSSLGTWMQTHNEISDSINHFSVEK